MATGPKARVTSFVRQVVRESLDETERRLQEFLRNEVQELMRVLRDQGDAADEVAETFGRTLTRLSAELDRLGERLDALRLGDPADREGRRP